MSRDRFRREHEDVSQAAEGLDIDGALQSLADSYVRRESERARVAEVRKQHGAPEPGMFARFIDFVSPTPESPQELERARAEETARVERRERAHNDPAVLEDALARARAIHAERAGEHARRLRPRVEAARPESDDDLASLLESYGFEGLQGADRRAMEIQANRAQLGEAEYNTPDPDMEKAYRQSVEAARRLNDVAPAPVLYGPPEIYSRDPRTIQYNAVERALKDDVLSRDPSLEPGLAQVRQSSHGVRLEEPMFGFDDPDSGTFGLRRGEGDSERDARAREAIQRMGRGVKVTL